MIVTCLLACKHDRGEACVLDRDCESNNCAKQRCSTGQVGEPCVFDIECLGSCVDGMCRGLGGDGDRCAGSFGKPLTCNAGLTCDADIICRSSDAIARRRAAAVAAVRQEEERQRKAAADAEARMLAASGITERAPAEALPAAPAGPGTRVRIVEVQSRQTAFAACRNDERLTGGGCRSAEAVIGSYPTHHGPEDAVGARWNCIGDGEIELTAFALCAKLR